MLYYIVIIGEKEIWTMLAIWGMDTTSVFSIEKKNSIEKKRLFICTTNVLLHLSCESSRVAGDNVYLTTLRLTLKFQCLWNRPWHKRRILTNIDKIQVRAFLYVFIGQIKRVKLEVRHWNKA